MTWIEIIITVLIALAFNAPALFLYMCTAFYFYFLNGYTFRRDHQKKIEWSQTIAHVPDVDKTINLLCKKGCCSFAVGEYTENEIANGHKN